MNDQRCFHQRSLAVSAVSSDCFSVCVTDECLIPITALVFGTVYILVALE